MMRTTFIAAVSAGLLGGALVGLVEGLYLLSSAGLQDGRVLLYALVLYGLIGGFLSAAVGVFLLLVGRLRPVSEWVFGWAGFSAPISALGLVIGRYLLNKVVFLEQGVPLWALGLWVLVLIGFSALTGLLFSRAGARLKAAHFGRVYGLLVAMSTALLSQGGTTETDWSTGRSISPQLKDAPNVVWIMVDTLRADALGLYGQSPSPSPAIDAFSADAIVFEQAIAGASWTRSCGATLFTSRFPSAHNTGTKSARLPEALPTWADVLQSSGVGTGALINNINMSATFGFDQGFDRFVYEAPEYRLGGSESVFGLSMYKLLLKVAERVGSDKRVAHYYQPASRVLNDARAFMTANRSSRYGLFVHLMEPHDPYFEHPYLNGGDKPFNGVGYARAETEHPDPAMADTLKQVYLDEITHMDTELAGFFEWMKSEGLYENTVIALTADHGEEFYEHGGWWHGTTLYDEQIHVPLIIKLPGNERAGERVMAQVRTVDVAPTLVELMGLTPDPSWQGRDLIGPAMLSPRVAIAEEDFEGNVLSAIRKGSYKYIRANEANPRGLPTEALFDLHADPAERRELLAIGAPIDGDYPGDIAKELGAALDGIIDAGRGTAVEAGEASVSAADCERLKALGYLDDGAECE